MTEEKLDKVFNGMSKEGLDTIDKLFETTENPSGLELLGALFALNDDDFEVLRPVMQDTLIESYNDPQIQMQMLQAFAQAGISIDDLINHQDEILNQLFDIEELDLSQSKKDFFVFIFTSFANIISASSLNPAHTVEIPVEICRENAKLPSYATNGSGAMDIYSPEEVTLRPGECKIISVGIKVAIPHGYALLIQPRSGLSRKIKLRIPNSPGLIDEDYHEEIGVIVENIDPPIKQVGSIIKSVKMTSEDVGISYDANLYGSDITIGQGERFAQMRLVEVPRVKWREVKSLGTFDKDHGMGFGSSGTN